MSAPAEKLVDIPPTDGGTTDHFRAQSIAASISQWFAAGHRDLPWRRTRDPYAVWVSEVMLQQTRVETVAPRFLKWMERFPSVAVLAEAPLDDVLAEWSGLGYYARARNLHAAARMVAEEYGGRIPDDEAGIAALPGIGRYTTGAILSIAFGKKAPILDGNVERVLARAFRVAGDPRHGSTREQLWRLAAEVAGGDHDPSQVNQGLMELGALVCSPRRPACLACPITRLCEARRHGDAESFPFPTVKTKVTAVEQVTIALIRDRKVLLVRRPPEGLWGGLFELPSGEPLVGETPLCAARRIAQEKAGLEVIEAAPMPAPNDRFVQELTHLRVTFHAFRADAPRTRVKRAGYDAHQWIDLARARLLGIARSTQRLLAALADEETQKRRAIASTRRLT